MRTLDAEEVSHWPSAIWIRMTSSMFIELVAGEGCGDEMRRARGMVTREGRGPTCFK